MLAEDVLNLKVRLEREVVEGLGDGDGDVLGGLEDVAVSPAGVEGDGVADEGADDAVGCRVSRGGGWGGWGGGLLGFRRRRLRGAFAGVILALVFGALVGVLTG